MAKIKERKNGYKTRGGKEGQEREEHGSNVLFIIHAFYLSRVEFTRAELKDSIGRRHVVGRIKP